jgi:putative Ca2+/H+ antiporter (TMEM165/GDT1 family)
VPTIAFILSVFGIIFVAELPDKTALAALVLATRHKAWIVFSASASALLAQSVIAVVAGGLLSALPQRPVGLAAGAVFLVSAVVMGFRRAETAEDAAGAAPGSATSEPTGSSDLRAFLSAFGVVFVAEWGDLTQIGTAALAARSGRPVAVLVGATLALWSVAALAVLVGRGAGRLLDPLLLRRLAAGLFALVGVALVWGSW